MEFERVGVVGSGKLAPVERRGTLGRLTGTAGRKAGRGSYEYGPGVSPAPAGWAA